MNDKLRIFKMVENGRISAKEGIDLLSSLEKENGLQIRSNSNSMVKIKVKSDTGDKINVSIPVSLLDVGLKMGGKYVDNIEGLDLRYVVEMIKSGVNGKILDIESEDGTIVEIIVE